MMCANLVRVLDDSEISLSSDRKVGGCETWNVRILNQIAYCISDAGPRSHIASVPKFHSDRKIALPNYDRNRACVG